MLSLKNGNILESRAEAVINTVNTKGIMGKGIALQFKKAYPEMFEEYRKASKAGMIVIGKMHVWHSAAILGPKYIINFPTKDDWKHPSRLEYIEQGLVDLVQIIKESEISSIAIPPLGCGNGGLGWNVVKPLIINAMKDFNSLDVELYEPAGAPEVLVKTPGKTKKMTFSRALVLKLFHRYCVLGYDLTLLEAQKLCFFLQEFGEPLRLRYKKHIYGPYADNMRHVLIDFEGIYTQGFVDGLNNKPDKTISLLPQALTESEAFLVANKSEMNEGLNRLSLVEKLIEGYETPFGMELLSTVFWIVKHEGVKQREEIINAVHAWNPRKAQLMRPEFIDKAINRIAEFQSAL
jgi:O-acetyl-ADP-ribose deacetylase (regulator of RNase III)